MDFGDFMRFGRKKGRHARVPQKHALGLDPRVDNGFAIRIRVTGKGRPLQMGQSDANQYRATTELGQLKR
jgi:hypothetical protein